MYEILIYSNLYLDCKGTSLLHVLEEAIAVVAMMLLFPNGSPIAERLQKNVASLIENGLYFKWEEEVMILSYAPGSLENVRLSEEKINI